MSWADEVRAAREAGWTRFVALTAVDGWESGEIEVVLRVADAAGAQRELSCAVARVGGSLESVAGVYPAAAYAERELRATFGIAVAGLAERDAPPLTDLRKDALVEERQQRTWPGAKSDDGRARRRQLPIGVPDPTAPDEVARVTSAWGAGRGGRGRR